MFFSMIYSDFQGLKVSRLGFGTMRLPMNDDKVVNFEEGCKMVDYAMANGINYFDTAYRYHEGQAEFFVRDAITKRFPREDFFLADKMPVWLCKEPADVKRIFEEQLENCGVEYFDFYLLHSLTEGDWSGVLQNKVWEYLKEQKDAGKIRHLGMSVHCKPPLLEEILNSYGDIVEFVQIQMNYMDWDYIKAKELYDILIKWNKPIIIMEPIRGGMLANPASSKAREILDSLAKCQDGRTLSYVDFALGYVNQLDNVAVTLSGMSTLEQMKENIEFFNNPTLSKEQLDGIFRAGKVLGEDILVPCTACDYCYNCPAEIKISKIFKWYNDSSMKGFHFIWGSLSGMYEKLGPDAKDCLQCGACEGVCPQQINIIQRLQEIHEKYEELKKIGE